MKATGGTDTQIIQQHLRSTNVDTPIGNISFDDKGDLKAFDFVVYRWHADGTKSKAK